MGEHSSSFIRDQPKRSRATEILARTIMTGDLLLA